MNKDQIKGAAKEAAGEVQEQVGKVTGNASQQAKGHAREFEGKAQKKLGWQPEVDIHGLVRMMIDHDLEMARREKFAMGYQTV